MGTIRFRFEDDSRKGRWERMSKEQLSRCDVITLPIQEFLGMEKVVGSAIDLLVAIDERALQFAPEVRDSCRTLVERLNQYRAIAHPNPDRGDQLQNKRKFARKGLPKNPRKSTLRNDEGTDVSRSEQLENLTGSNPDPRPNMGPLLILPHPVSPK
jgi:hypothetical protein